MVQGSKRGLMGDGMVDVRVGFEFPFFLHLFVRGDGGLDDVLFKEVTEFKWFRVLSTSARTRLSCSFAKQARLTSL